MQETQRFTPRLIAIKVANIKDREKLERTKRKAVNYP